VGASASCSPPSSPCRCLLAPVPGQAALPTPIGGGPGRLALFADGKVTPGRPAAPASRCRSKAQGLLKAGDPDARRGAAERGGRQARATRCCTSTPPTPSRRGVAEQVRPDLESGIEKARVGLDILHFLQDPRCDPDWQIVDSSEIAGEIRRGEKLIAASETGDRRAWTPRSRPPPPADDDEPRKKAPRDGRGLIAGGSLLTLVGVGGLGIIGAGLATGAGAQKDIDALADGPTATSTRPPSTATSTQQGQARQRPRLRRHRRRRRRPRRRHRPARRRRQEAQEVPRRARQRENTASVQLLPAAGRGQAGLVLIGRF
jgi:hypothetical protein